MKKLIYIVSAFALIFSSCSKSEEVQEPTIDTSSILIKKRIYTEIGFPAETYIYTYTGNKLLKITDDSGYSNITYTGDLITLIQYYDNTNSLIASEHFTYNSSNKLVTNIHKDLEYNIGFKETYVYNSDGTISASKYDGDTTSQTMYMGYYKMFLSNNEVVKEENYDSIGDLVDTTTYTFDGKNNPFKNITGWAQLQYVQSQMGGVYQNVIHNNDPNEDLTNTYTYDSNNFPLTQTEKDNTNTVQGTTQYFY